MSPVESFHHIINKELNNGQTAQLSSRMMKHYFTQNDHWANQIALQITSAGLVQPGDFVRFCEASPQGLGFYLPNPSHQTARIQNLLQEANTKLVIASPDRVTALAGTLPCKVLVVANLERLVVAQLPSAITVTSRHASYLMFISESTEKPKGVVIEH
ncbi:Plipastatin synthase subunit D [Colletotrichum chlorophyti]|uniref:Plipastatin synthase subunit D n=1 Tax=Colletotrichum chlorophyti TaxID=708187 RepID=A0A1Q8RUD2_9PEZI|nr:Plipastatin synthase subunit D [Colletotrichum chlorophyti]